MYYIDEERTVLLTNIWLQNYAGSEINCLSLAKTLKAKGYNVEVATLEAGEPMLSEFMKENILVKNLLKEELTRQHYDIIWAHHAVVVDYVIFFKQISADKIILSSLSPFEPYECLPDYANEGSLCLANSGETKQKLITEGIDPNKILVFPNYVSTEWLCSENSRTYAATPKKVAIVSNHVPEELLHAKDILVERGCEVDIFGLGYKVTFIKPETLKPYDLVITIGKTVQYAMAMQIPVYCYDMHGGPGYLTSEELDRAAFYNFSGRGFPQKSAQVIAEDVVARYRDNLEMLPELLDFVRETSILENNIEDVLSAIDCSENFDVSIVRQRYAYRARGNQIVLRLFREREEKNTEIINKERHICNIMEELERQKTEAEKYRMELEGVLSSRSWRITTLLRKIAEWFRSIR